jgi:hypothetical protein
MRIKDDFVTNSSTTSFIVWGVSTDLGEIKKIKKLTDKLYDNYVNNETGEILTREEFLETVEQWDLYDSIQEILAKHNLESVMAPYDDVLYIGIDPFSIGNDETGLEFRMRVKNALDELDIPGDPGRIEESWQDG